MTPPPPDTDWRSLLEGVFEDLPDAAIFAGEDGRIVRANAAASALFGFTVEELRGTPMVSVLPENSGPRAPVRPVRETRGRRKDGSEIPVEVTSTPVGDPASGKVLALVRNISDRKQAEAALVESEARYRSLVHLSPEAILIHQQGRIIFANEATAALFGVGSAEELPGRQLIDFVPEEYRDVIRVRMAEDRPVHQPFGPIAVAAVRPGEGTVFLEVIGVRLAYQGGTAAQLVLRDVTDQRRAEQELLRLNRALRAVSSVNHALVRATDEQEFLNTVCRVIRDTGGHRLVWVGYAERDDQRSVRPVAWAGVEESYLETIRVTWDLSPAGLGPMGIAVRTGRPHAVRNTDTDLLHPLWRAEALRRGFKSIIGLPLSAAGVSIGALGIYAGEADAFDAEEVHLLTQLADDLAFGIAALRAQQERDRAVEELRDSQKELRNLSTYLQDAREAERTSVAREIHDELGQALTALKMDVAWMESELLRTHPEAAELVKERVDSMESLLDRTVKSVRRIATELRPVLLDSLGLAPALEWLTEEFSGRTGLSCTLTVDPDDLEVEKGRATALFRICQEALTNVSRHAQATTVSIRLTSEPEGMELRIVDNGKGFTPSPAAVRSFGLVGMRERAMLFGGILEIQSAPGAGTTVLARVPHPELPSVPLTPEE